MKVQFAFIAVLITVSCKKSGSQGDIIILEKSAAETQAADPASPAVETPPASSNDAQQGKPPASDEKETKDEDPESASNIAKLVGGWLSSCEISRTPPTQSPVKASKILLSFGAAGGGSAKIAMFKDIKCLSLLSQADAEAFIKGADTSGTQKRDEAEIKKIIDAVNGELIPFTYKGPKGVADGVVGNIDISLRSKTIHTSYKILANKLNIAEACLIPDVFAPASSSCPKMKGESAENRALTFEDPLVLIKWP